MVLVFWCDLVRDRGCSGVIWCGSGVLVQCSVRIREYIDTLMAIPTRSGRGSPITTSAGQYSLCNIYFGFAFAL